VKARRLPIGPARARRVRGQRTTARWARVVGSPVHGPSRSSRDEQHDVDRDPDRQPQEDGGQGPAQWRAVVRATDPQHDVHRDDGHDAQRPDDEGPVGVEGAPRHHRGGRTSEQKRQRARRSHGLAQVASAGGARAARFRESDHSRRDRGRLGSAGLQRRWAAAVSRPVRTCPPAPRGARGSTRSAHGPEGRRRSPSDAPGLGRLEAVGRGLQVERHHLGAPLGHLGTTVGEGGVLAAAASISFVARARRTGPRAPGRRPTRARSPAT
jgi:hypothetical protein